MEEKYTIEEFKKMFNAAELKALEEMDKQMAEAEEKVGEKNSSMRLIMSMQNMMFGSAIAQYLFKNK